MINSSRHSSFDAEEYEEKLESESNQEFGSPTVIPVYELQNINSPTDLVIGYENHESDEAKEHDFDQRLLEIGLLIDQADNINISHSLEFSNSNNTSRKYNHATRLALAVSATYFILAFSSNEGISLATTRTDNMAQIYSASLLMVAASIGLSAKEIWKSVDQIYQLARDCVNGKFPQIKSKSLFAALSLIILSSTASDFFGARFNLETAVQVHSGSSQDVYAWGLALATGTAIAVVLTEGAEASNGLHRYLDGESFWRHGSPANNVIVSLLMANQSVVNSFLDIASYRENFNIVRYLSAPSIFTTLLSAGNSIPDFVFNFAYVTERASETYEHWLERDYLRLLALVPAASAATWFAYLGYSENFAVLNDILQFAPLVHAMCGAYFAGDFLRYTLALGEVSILFGEGLASLAESFRLSGQSVAVVELDQINDELALDVESQRVVSSMNRHSFFAQSNNYQLLDSDNDLGAMSLPACTIL